MSGELFRHCPGCGQESVFEAPPCTDGHGASCAERVCVDCGTAVLLDPELSALVGARRAPERRAA